MTESQFLFWKGSFSLSSNQLFSHGTSPNVIMANQAEGQMQPVGHHLGIPDKNPRIDNESNPNISYSESSFYKWEDWSLERRVESAGIHILFLIILLSLTSGKVVPLWYPLNALWEKMNGTVCSVLQRHHCPLYFRGTIKCCSLVCPVERSLSRCCKTAVLKSFFGLRMPLCFYLKRALCILCL